MVKIGGAYFGTHQSSEILWATIQNLEKYFWGKSLMLRHTYGGFLKYGYPRVIQSLDHFSIESTMVTWGSPILRRNPYIGIGL